MDFQAILKTITDWLLGKGLSAVLIILLTLVALKGVRIVVERMTRFLNRQKVGEENLKRATTLSSVTRHLLNVTVLIIGAVMLLDHLGIEIGPILAAAGIVGLAVGFGAQNLVKDVINGFFILLEDQLRVGDVVQIAGKGGLVERVNLKMTVLRDLAGNVHYIPNGNIDLITNMTKEYSRYVFEVGVAYREDVDEVSAVMRLVDEELRNDPEFKDDILEPIEILGLDQFADSALIIKARIMTKPIKQWRIGREFNRRLKKAFDERGIEIPFPHLTLYAGQDKDGSAPPLHIRTAETDPLKISVQTASEPNGAHSGTVPFKSKGKGSGISPDSGDYEGM